jgi:hypothetical protein
MSKNRYAAGRFRARRFAAGKYRGVGPSIIPFMRGFLRIFATLKGEVQIKGQSSK